MRVSPAGARFDPLTSTQVFGAMVALPPSALATFEISGTASAVIVNARDMNWRAPVSQPFIKKIIPLSLVCPEGAPGDMDDGYHPSNCWPRPSALHAGVLGNCEFSMGCGTVQSSRSRLVAVE